MTTATQAREIIANRIAGYTVAELIASAEAIRCTIDGPFDAGANAELALEVIADEIAHRNGVRVEEEVAVDAMDALEVRAAYRAEAGYATVDAHLDDLEA